MFCWAPHHNLMNSRHSAHTITNFPPCSSTQPLTKSDTVPCEYILQASSWAPNQSWINRPPTNHTSQNSNFCITLPFDCRPYSHTYVCILRSLH